MKILGGGLYILCLGGWAQSQGHGASSSAMASRSPGSAMPPEPRSHASEAPDPPWPPEAPDPPWLPEAPDPPWLPESPVPPWMPSLYPCPPPTSRAPTPPPRFCYYVAGCAVREGEVLSQNGPYPQSLITFTCT